MLLKKRSRFASDLKASNLVITMTIDGVFYIGGFNSSLYWVEQTHHEQQKWPRPQLGDSLQPVYTSKLTAQLSLLGRYPTNFHKVIHQTEESICL